MTGRARRRDRRAARAIRRESESREGLASDLLTDPKRVSADAALIKKALRWGGLDDTKRNQVIDRLVKLVEKAGCQRVTKDGDTVIDEELADKNAIAASSVLVSIEAQNQRDEHLEKRISGPLKQQPQTTINVGVNVDNRLDERRRQTLSIIERVGARRGIQLNGSGSPGVIVHENEGSE
jgi:hypothetical protein